MTLIQQQSRVITLCAYRDVSGMFTTENKVSCSVKEDTILRSQSEAETFIQDLRYEHHLCAETYSESRHVLFIHGVINVKCVCSNTVDDEEEMLYGDSNASAAPSKEEMGRSSGVLGSSGSEGSASKAEPSHWCMIIRENGVMEVWGYFRRTYTLC